MYGWHETLSSLSHCKYEEQLREQQNQMQKDIGEHAAKQKVGWTEGLLNLNGPVFWSEDKKHFFFLILYRAQKRKKTTATESEGRAAKKLKMKEFNFWNLVYNFIIMSHCLF